jgi:hypothetical protein
VSDAVSAKSIASSLLCRENLLLLLRFSTQSRRAFLSREEIDVLPRRRRRRFIDNRASRKRLVPLVSRGFQNSSRSLFSILSRFRLVAFHARALFRPVDVPAFLRENIQPAVTTHDDPSGTQRRRARVKTEPML